MELFIFFQELSSAKQIIWGKDGLNLFFKLKF
jgi:hypothetical protein